MKIKAEYLNGTEKEIVYIIGVDNYTCHIIDKNAMLRIVRITNINIIDERYIPIQIGKGEK